MSAPEIPSTFLQRAAETLHWLSGSKIIDAFLDYGEKWNVSPPYTEYPLGGFTTKRQVIYENLKVFSSPQQFYIIEELCNHPSFSPGAPSKDARTLLKQELYSKYGQFRSGDITEQPAIPVSREVGRVRYNTTGEWILNGVFVVLWMLSRPFVWAYRVLYWFALAVTKETGNRIVQIVGGLIAVAIVGFIASFFINLH